MVLKEDYLRLMTIGFLVCLDLVIYLLEKDITRIGIRDVECLREEFCTYLCSVVGTHKSVDKGRVKVHYKSSFHAVVE